MVLAILNFHILCAGAEFSADFTNESIWKFSTCLVMWERAAFVKNRACVDRCCRECRMLVCRYKRLGCRAGGSRQSRADTAKGARALWRCYIRAAAMDGRGRPRRAADRGWPRVLELLCVRATRAVLKLAALACLMPRRRDAGAGVGGAWAAPTPVSCCPHRPPHHRRPLDSRLFCCGGYLFYTTKYETKDNIVHQSEEVTSW